jgi:hypothetical protein
MLHPLLVIFKFVGACELIKNLRSIHKVASLKLLLKYYIQVSRYRNYSKLLPLPKETAMAVQVPETYIHRICFKYTHQRKSPLNNT